MKKVKKILKITVFTFIAIVLSTLIFSVGFFYTATKGVALDSSKLEDTKNTFLFEVFDCNGTSIKPSSENHISIKKLSSNTKNAFICAEDKRFYTHKGIDFVRIGGAVVSNLKSKSFSQGASTISQQLIKNTHLSNEKTLKRKLKEIKLTKQLEKKYSKNDILELYLNNIYFGNGCYGIENASMHYFGKSAKNLTLAESALLAATINAPSVYDIENNQEKTIVRRNLILNLMKKYGKISTEEYESATTESVNLKITKLSNNNYIFNEIIEEACSILKTNENQLKSKKLKIFTDINLSLQNKISEKIKSNYSNLNKKNNIASIVINNKTNQIVSVVGNKNVLNSKKQPGSTIKPILVFAPAIENKIITPATKILDEKINISGYQPENADRKFHGYVSVRNCLKQSLNIPAVKILQETGIENAQNFAKNLGIDFEESDKNLAIALGGFTTGTTLKTLADAYSSFANNGNFSPSKYISKITLNGKNIYTKTNKTISAMSDSTAYLITDMLKDTAKTGTAKRLKDFDFDIASKTGTVGKDSSTKNTDAFNVAYTSEHTIISYFGGNNMNESINGSTYPTMLTKNILELLYSSKKPSDFKKPSSVIAQTINKSDYENNIVSKTDNPENALIEIFSKNNLPAQTNSSLNLNLDVFNFSAKKPILSFFISPNHEYKIIRTNKNKEEIISSLKNINESKTINHIDSAAKTNEIYTYKVEVFDTLTGKTHSTNTISLKAY